jgi:hypothetical protein
MRQKLKVINLGFPKSGTTTLARALRAAGLKVADWKLNPSESGGQRGYVGRLMYAGFFRSGDPLALMPSYDAFTEIDIIRNKRNYWPQTDWGIIRAIRACHPGARFLLSTRDAMEHAGSMLRWSDMGTRRLPQSTIPGLPKGHGGSAEDLALWIEGHIAFCRQVFAGAEDFLEFRIDDDAAPGRISGFLELPLPWWGVANANPPAPVNGIVKGAV